MLKLRNHLNAHPIAGAIVALALVAGSTGGYLVGHDYGYAAGNYAGGSEGYTDGIDTGTSQAADCLAEPVGGADAPTCVALRSKVAHDQLDIAHKNFVHDPLPVVATLAPAQP